MEDGAEYTRSESFIEREVCQYRLGRRMIGCERRNSSIARGANRISPRRSLNSGLPDLISTPIVVFSGRARPSISTLASSTSSSAFSLERRGRCDLITRPVTTAPRSSSVPLSVLMFEISVASKLSPVLEECDDSVEVSCTVMTVPAGTWVLVASTLVETVDVPN